MQTMKRRNWTARAAIMRKGGVHEKSNKAKRQKDKQAFNKKIRAEHFGSYPLGLSISNNSEYALT